MKKTTHFPTKYKALLPKLEEQIANFSKLSRLVGDGGRNVIKAIEIDGLDCNIKSFKIPGIINKIAYRFFRKSKAERSFTYAETLINKGLGTPKPIGYICNYDAIGLTSSYYISEQITADLTYRELVQEPDFPENEIILRQFVHFTHKLHENKVLFKDHSPGNMLIKKNTEGTYDFYLVDLNRMTFKDLSFEERMKNFSRLTPKKEMVAVMSDEYTKLTKLPYEKVFNAMWGETSKFQEKFFRKKRIKKALLFRKA